MEGRGPRPRKTFTVGQKVGRTIPSSCSKRKEPYILRVVLARSGPARPPCPPTPRRGLQPLAAASHLPPSLLLPPSRSPTARKQPFVHHRQLGRGRRERWGGAGGAHAGGSFPGRPGPPPVLAMDGLAPPLSFLGRHGAQTAGQCGGLPAEHEPAAVWARLDVHEAEAFPLQHSRRGSRHRRLFLSRLQCRSSCHSGGSTGAEIAHLCERNGGFGSFTPGRGRSDALTAEVEA